MFKVLISLFFSFHVLSINALTFNVDESNSVNKVSLLKIENIENNYFRFKVNVMQSNNWDFRSNIYITSNNLNKDVIADFNGNEISFTLSNDDYLALLDSEFLYLRSYLQYQDSFYLPPFRETESYKALETERFKESFVEKK